MDNITQDKVTVINIDDYIRQEKREGRREIYWNKNGWDVLKQYVHVATNGVTYLGAKHYLK